MRWCYLLRLILWVTLSSVWVPRSALAGGAEYPAEGGQGIGRGGANMARADNSWVLSRNPALLSDLWGSQLSIGGNLAFTRPCFHPSGGFGWGEEGGDGVFILNDTEGPLYKTAEPGSKGGAIGSDPTTLQTSYDGIPYPEICAKWDSTFSPTIALTTRVNDELGIGIALLPPELAMLPQYGNSDGTLDTRSGKRPNPLRYFSSLFSFTYFNLTAGVGYKPLSWMRVGLAVRWTMLMIDTIHWDNDLQTRDPSSDKRQDIFFKDLFIPGIITSIHFVPFENLDIAIGYKWEDRIKTQQAKMDVTQNVWGYGDGFAYRSPAMDITTIPSTRPTVNHNIPITVDSPPITPPQLSIAIRYSERIRPRPQKYTWFNKWNSPVRDSLADEKWDIELDAIYYFNSVKDKTTITYPENQTFVQTIVPVQGDAYQKEVLAGECTANDTIKNKNTTCPGKLISVDEYHGKDQISLRLGGDYNLLPSILALRAGVSWENRGVDIEYAHPMYSYPFMRLGVHVGITWRISKRTDFSFSYAHFFQEIIELAINDDNRGGLPDRFMEQDGKTLSKDAYQRKYHITTTGDGTAKYSKFGDQYYHNAGKHLLHLDVIGGTLMQHF